MSDPDDAESPHDAGDAARPHPAPAAAKRPSGRATLVASCSCSCSAPSASCCSRRSATRRCTTTTPTKRWRRRTSSAPSASAARAPSARARSHSTGDGVDVHGRRSTASTVHGRTTGRPARAVQAGDPRWCSRATGPRRPARLRQRPHPGQARRRLRGTNPDRIREAERRHGAGDPPATAVNAALGTAGVSLGLVGSRPRHRHRSASASPGSRPDLRAAEPQLRRRSCSSAPLLAFVRHGAGADHPRLHDEVRRRQRQHADPVPLQRRRPCGRRSRARSCCGR